jgi:hypothetical protein
LLALTILEAGLSECYEREPLILSFIESREQTALVLAIPAAILLGLLSNIVVFMGVNDLLVRDPVKSGNPRLFELHNALAGRVRDRCWQALAMSDAAMREDFDKYTDVEIIMLPVLGPQNLAYLREQYWYHLEFQMNMFLSLVALFVGALVNTWAGSTSYATFIGCALLWLVPFSLAWLGLLVSARRNYSRHISKIASLMAGVLFTQQAKSAAQGTGPAGEIDD